MRYVILGTAGHIDHGKSSLVKALTGIDPDRLKEEKERGITIDLGFADLAIGDDLSIGIVDVPGHERLIKNMLAGAGGIDMVMMVIAADEGIMPQSREHLHICNLLRIKAGLVALTKTDLVEPDWIEMVRDEVANFVKGTFLEGAEIVPVSSATGEGLDDLKDAIARIARESPPKPTAGLFRLPVDRVFSKKGFGTVVTGTVISGVAGLDEQIELLPVGVRTKVRGLHTHGREVERICAGQRGAINLQGIEREEPSRGDMLVAAGRFVPTGRLDVQIELLPDASDLKNRAEVHFHLGTSETVARVVIYGGDAKIKIAPGGKAFCQLRLRAPVVAQAGDRFVIRRFSPLETIGGGVVLDPTPRKRRRSEGTADLEILLGGSLEDRIAEKARRARIEGITRAAMEGWARAEVPEVRDAIGSLKGRKILLKFDETLIHRDAIAEFRSELLALLEEYHKTNPMKPGMPKEEARVRMLASQKIFDGLLDMTAEVKVNRDIISLASFSPAASAEDVSRVMALLLEAPFMPPVKSELAARLGRTEKQVSEILALMHESGSAVRISDTISITKDACDTMLAKLREHYAKTDAMTVAEFRDILGTTRKYALPLLEYLDSNRITMRIDDIRKLRAGI